MRIEVTLQGAGEEGDDVDIAITAAPDTAWGLIDPLLRARWPRADPRWAGPVRLRAELVLGRPPLVSGAVLAAERVASEPDAPCVEVITGPDAGQRITLGARTVVLGRAPGAQLQLSDPRISRQHAQLRVAGGRIEIRDLGSTSGTYVDGLSARDWTVVGDHAVVRVGDTALARPRLLGDDPEQDSGRSDSSVADPGDTLPAPRRPRIPIAAALAPLVAGAVLALVLGTPQFLLFAALTPLTLLLSSGAELLNWLRGRPWLRGRVGVAGPGVAARRHLLDAAAVAHGALCSPGRWWQPSGGTPALRVPVGLAAPPGSTASPPAAVYVDVAAGPVAVVGAAPAALALARAMVSTLAVTTSPSDLHLVAPTDLSWRWARWLPHRRPGTGPHREVLVVDARAVSHFDAPAIVVAPSRELVRWCRAVIEISGTEAVLHDRAGHHRLLPSGMTAARAEQVARALAGAGEAHEPAARVPRSCRLLTLLDGTTTAADLRQAWSSADRGLCVPIGSAADGPATLDLVGDGPHLLVAGTTGSGKSELLQSLVVALAARYPPSLASLLLIDFKGGAAFDTLSGLPHCVGLVTDLDDHLAARVLTSLTSEIRRRERLLRARGAADILALGSGDDLARLVIVIDEFATLVAAVPTFLPTLISLAQRGRSLGLHLVLATQRPAGAIGPEIRANVALRVCLRVTNPADSLDVLDAADAAGIDPATPGRAFLRAGTGLREVQVGQVSHAGAQRAVEIAELDHRLRPVAAARRDTPARSDLETVLAAARDAAQGRPAPHRPWLDPLPARLETMQLGVGRPSHLVLGVVDDPQHQQQRALDLDLSGGVGALIVGGPRSGRSTAIRAIAAGACAMAGNQLHVITAHGASERSWLAGLPCVGTVTGADDDFDTTARLVELLTDEIAGRRETRTGAAPALLVDGWDALAAASDARDGGRTATRVLGLLRDAPSAGATVVLTAGRSALAPRIASCAGTVWLLAGADPDTFALVGIDRRQAPPPLPGRGVRLADGVEFQLAVPPPRPLACPGTHPPRLRALPRLVSVRELATALPVRLGLGGPQALPIGIDPTAGARRLLVAGPTRSGRSTVLRVLLAGAAAAGHPVVLAAPPRSPLHAAARSLALPCLTPTGEPPPDTVPAGAWVLVDDAEAFADTPTGERLLAWSATDAVLAVAARADQLAITMRGVAAEVRRAGCGVLLQPGPVDGELLGAELPARRSEHIPGRGVLVPDPDWGHGRDPLPIQIALP